MAIDAPQFMGVPMKHISLLAVGTLYTHLQVDVC